MKFLTVLPLVYIIFLAAAGTMYPAGTSPKKMLLRNDRHVCQPDEKNECAA